MTDVYIRRSEEVEGFGKAAGFDGILHLEARKDLLTVTADGVDADMELFGDLGAFQPGVDQGQDLSLAVAKDGGIFRGGDLLPETGHGIYRDAPPFEIQGEGAVETDGVGPRCRSSPQSRR